MNSSFRIGETQSDGIQHRCHGNQGLTTVVCRPSLVSPINVRHAIAGVLNTTTDVVELKFLHSIGASTFHWPRRDDIDQVHVSNIFYGPVTVPNFISGPFVIPEQKAVAKVFQAIGKQKKA
ncbi:hypothetical protein QZH41_001507 [Actinostola sp. cb2023]|nr:hypothetical protein QZH41_001507 [Actinostola sp. cb2023]